MSAVDHPAHYNQHPSGVECIDVIEHMTFNVGSAIKYLWRSGLKDGNPELQELAKARWYIDREIDRVKREAAGDQPATRGDSGATATLTPNGLRSQE